MFFHGVMAERREGRVTTQMYHENSDENEYSYYIIITVCGTTKMKVTV